MEQLETLRSLLEHAHTARAAITDVRRLPKPRDEDRALHAYLAELPTLLRRQLNAAARATAHDESILATFGSVQEDDAFITTVSIEQFDAALARVAAEGLALGEPWAVPAPALEPEDNVLVTPEIVHDVLADVAPESVPPVLDPDENA